MSVLPAPEEKAAVVEAMFDRVAPSYERLNHLISGGQDRRWRHRLVRDLALAPRFAAVAAVEKLARLHRDFRSLLCNFVNFADFYSRDRWAVFQAGTLYLDGRSTELCVRVDGPNPLAATSKVYLAYCACSRAGSAPMTIAAAFTQDRKSTRLNSSHT